MTKEERETAIEYFKFHRKIFCDDHLKNCPKDSIAYQATLKERTFYDMAIKALEQQSSEDVMAIHTQGLDEGIRCAMCTNSMKSDTGCDGGCRVDEDMYKKVMDTIRNHIVSPVTPTQCIAEVRFSKEDLREICNERIEIECTHGTCKDCKKYRNSLEHCTQWVMPTNDDFYCADYEKAR